MDRDRAVRRGPCRVVTGFCCIAYNGSERSHGGESHGMADGAARMAAGTVCNTVHLCDDRAGRVVCLSVRADPPVCSDADAGERGGYHDRRKFLFASAARRRTAGACGGNDRACFRGRLCCRRGVYRLRRTVAPTSARVSDGKDGAVRSPFSR